MSLYQITVTHRFTAIAIIPTALNTYLITPLCIYTIQELLVSCSQTASSPLFWHTDVISEGEQARSGYVSGGLTYWLTVLYIYILPRPGVPFITR